MNKTYLFLISFIFSAITANAQTYEFSGIGQRWHGTDTTVLASCRFEFTEATCNPRIGKEPSLWIFFSGSFGKDICHLSFYPSKVSSWCSPRVSPRIYGLTEYKDEGNALLYFQDEVFPIIYLYNGNGELYAKFVFFKKPPEFSLFMTKLIIEAEKRGILSWKKVDQIE